LKFIGKELDNTEEITKKIREVLRQKSPLHRRLAEAYPKLEAVKVKIKEKKEEIKQQVEEQKREIIEKVENQKREIIEQIQEQKVEIGKIIDETAKKIENKSKQLKQEKKQ
jgi:diphthamide biosynthesis methyltransferase